MTNEDLEILVNDVNELIEVLFNAPSDVVEYVVDAIVSGSNIDTDDFIEQFGTLEEEEE